MELLLKYSLVFVKDIRLAKESALSDGTIRNTTLYSTADATLL